MMLRFLSLNAIFEKTLRMKKVILLLFVLTIILVQKSNAQQSEIYAKSNFINFGNSAAQGSSLGATDSRNVHRSNVNLILGLTRVQKNNTQFSGGLQFSNSAYTDKYNQNNEYQESFSGFKSRGMSMGVEAGIGKRIAHADLLFIPNASINFQHSLSAESVQEQYYNSKINNTKYHTITDAVGGNNFSIYTTLSQGLYYKLGQHLKIGVELNAQLGVTKFYGKSIQSTRDILNNSAPSNSLVVQNDRRVFLSSGIQLALRYSL